MIRVSVIVAALSVCATVSAAPVRVILVAHNEVSAAGGLSTAVWDGSEGNALQFDYGAPAGSGWVSPTASTATWTWDPASGVLASNGVFWSSFYTGQGVAPNVRSLLGFKVTDLLIDTGKMETSAAAYQCNEGAFGSAALSRGLCAGVEGVRPDFVTIGPFDPFRPTRTELEYNFGGDAAVVNRTIVDPESSFADPRSLASTFPFYTVITDEGPGGFLRLGNQADICFSFEECSANTALYGGAAWLTFTIVPLPSAVWLLGSALLGLGWLRHRRQYFSAGRGVAA